MTDLYPRLPLAIATALAEERAGLEVIDLVGLGATSHEAVCFAPTGGNRVSAKQLEKLQKDVRVCAAKCGYPTASMPRAGEEFDVQCAALLHRSMQLYPAEAAHLEMWAFITTILLPDVVRWRFSGQITSLDRYIGGDRGLRRNTFGRLWWRAYLLNLELGGDDDYALLRQLTEDELVQITERPSIAENRGLAKAVARAHISGAINHPNLPRRALMREGIKRVRRRLPVICYEMLNDQMLQADVDTAFAAAADALDALAWSANSIHRE